MENTALSTWAGTSNITTLGTIATGAWNGTNILPAKIATDTSNRFITDAERTTWNAKISSELDSKVGSLTSGYIPKWGTGGSLVNGTLYDSGGNVGIGTTIPGAKIDTIGEIRSSRTS